MFKRRDKRTYSGARREAVVPAARGGMSLGAILTGVVVALGALFLLSAVVGGVLATTGTSLSDVSQGDAVEATAAVGVAIVVATLLAYLWGGYTAGRMGRGAGAGNGLMVPLVALILGVVVGALASALGATAQLNLPFTTTRLPIEDNNLVDLGTGFAIASLVAMFLGGLLGGMMGHRWHTKLERRVGEEAVAERRVEGAHPEAGRATAEEEARAAEERRRLAERGAQRREHAPTRPHAPVPPAPTAGRSGDPVVTRHDEHTTEKPSLTDRIRRR
ncbi:MAG: hypothetical protein ACRDKZ_00145 [Actinomycetota bacterium]